MSYAFGLVCEGPADARTAKALVERVVTDEVDWLLDTFEEIVDWSGIEEGTEYTTWAGDDGVKGLARAADIRLHGRFSGELGDGCGDALQATKAMRLFRAQRPESDGLIVFLVRDTDGEPARRDGMERARDESTASFEVVLGLAHTKRECWVLTAFEPEDEDEEERLEELKQELGFDPTAEAHRLTAKSSGAKRDAKRVLDELTAGDVGREDDAVASAYPDDLENAGGDVSLRTFIREVREAAMRIFVGEET